MDSSEDTLMPTYKHRILAAGRKLSPPKYPGVGISVSVALLLAHLSHIGAVEAADWLYWEAVDKRNRKDDRLLDEAQRIARDAAQIARHMDNWFFKTGDGYITAATAKRVQDLKSRAAAARLTELDLAHALGGVAAADASIEEIVHERRLHDAMIARLDALDEAATAVATITDFPDPGPSHSSAVAEGTSSSTIAASLLPPLLPPPVTDLHSLGASVPVDDPAPVEPRPEAAQHDPVAPMPGTYPPGRALTVIRQDPGNASPLTGAIMMLLRALFHPALDIIRVFSELQTKLAVWGAAFASGARAASELAAETSKHLWEWMKVCARDISLKIIYVEERLSSMHVRNTLSSLGKVLSGAFTIYGTLCPLASTACSPHTAAMWLTMGCAVNMVYSSYDLVAHVVVTFLLWVWNCMTFVGPTPASDPLYTIAASLDCPPCSLYLVL